MFKTQTFSIMCALALAAVGFTFVTPSAQAIQYCDVDHEDEFYTYRVCVVDCPSLGSCCFFVEEEEYHGPDGNHRGSYDGYCAMDFVEGTDSSSMTVCIAGPSVSLEQGLPDTCDLLIQEQSGGLVCHIDNEGGGGGGESWSDTYKFCVYHDGCLLYEHEKETESGRTIHESESGICPENALQ